MVWVVRDGVEEPHTPLPEVEEPGEVGEVEVPMLRPGACTAILHALGAMVDAEAQRAFLSRALHDEWAHVGQRVDAEEAAARAAAHAEAANAELDAVAAQLERASFEVSGVLLGIRGADFTVVEHEG